MLQRLQFGFFFQIEEYEIKSQINAQKQAQIQCSIVQQSTSHLTKQNEYNLPETIPALQPITRHFAKQGEYTLPETIPALQPIIQNQQTELVDLDLTVHSSGCKIFLKKQIVIILNDNFLL